MKEFKFNIQYLLKRKELYFSIIVILLINIIQVALCVNESFRLNKYIEQCYSSEYQFILYNAQITLNVLIIIVFPIALSLIFSDTSWMDYKDKTLNMLYTRLDYKKNIVVRLCLSVIITFIISFLGFLVNYFLLRLIYGSGNYLTYDQSFSFYLESTPEFFLDDLRLSNPALFVISISFTVSLLLGLLSGISYLGSFFAKQRVIIYFLPLIFLIVTELLFSRIGLSDISYISMLQPFSILSIKDYIIGIVVLLCIISVLLVTVLRKKDVLI